MRTIGLTFTAAVLGLAVAGAQSPATQKPATARPAAYAGWVGSTPVMTPSESVPGAPLGNIAAHVNGPTRPSAFSPCCSWKTRTD